MGIIFDQRSRRFHLKALDTSYVFKVYRDGYLAHEYWGRKIRSANLTGFIPYGRRPLSPNPDPEDEGFSLDTMPNEYPGYGRGDFRHPAYEVQLEDGSTVSDLRYTSHRIYSGKPKLEGLPATYAEGENDAQTLEVELTDRAISLKVILYYTVFENYNVIARSVRFINDGTHNIRLNRVMSVSVDFDSSDYDLLQLSGSWGRERHIERRRLFSGIQSVESRRGASSHQQNPFIALLGRDANEDNGEAYGFNLVYSGNFIAQAEVDQFKTTRVSIGINPFDFSWLLKPGQSFQSPEAVLVYSYKGLGDMSRTYHKFYINHLCRSPYKLKERPVLINNWEATYFDFNAEKLEEIAKTVKELGIELFVLDDGWFGKRNSDRCSLGDWHVNRDKLPGGLKELAQSINSMGLKFGLWFEPEMVSPDSDLYRKHPDWCIHVDGRSRTQSRHQLVLDLSRKDVCDAVIKMVSEVLSSAPISYVKWDMNRNMTEVGSKMLPPERQRETAHRYILGLYRIMDEITSAFPHILFESCSGGGGRFDPGILFYMPQTWTSDDTDAVERLYIQYGTSIVYPAVTMGCHVSAVPNHQVHRITGIDMRGHVAMSGNLGYELDIRKLSNDEKETIRKQVDYYKSIRKLVQFGDMYRLKSPYEGNEASWMFVDGEKEEAVVFYFRIMAQPNGTLSRLRLKGLIEDRDYEIVGASAVYGGDELMNAGIRIPDLKGDFKSVVWRLKRV